MHIVDPNAEYRGVNVVKLMDRAGKESLKAIQKKWKLKGKKIQIFCGGGNNGGDGFALAAELLKLNSRDISGNVEIEVILAVDKKKIRTTAAKHHFQRITSLIPQLTRGIVKKFTRETKFDGDILVDALLGIGIEGKLKKPFDEMVKKISKALTSQISGEKKKLVSLDIPTGNLKPDLVIAFHSSKLSPMIKLSLNSPLHKKGKRSSGAKSSKRKKEHRDFYPEVVVPIGIPKIAETHFGPGDVRVFFPSRGKDSHKSQNGRVLVVGGSEDFVGAPLFAGLGTIASGVDLVDVWVPEVSFAASRKFCPNLLIKSFAGNQKKLTLTAVPEILKYAQKNNCTIILGCGLGLDEETKEAVLEIVRKTKQPLVLDAGAILPELLKLKLNPNTILTPHAGELQRITKSQNSKAAEKLAKKLNTVILLKGKVDAIHSPSQTRWNDAGSAVATVGGTGDTLAGLIGGLLSRGVEPFEAAGIATFLLGIASEQLALKYESITPQMLAKKIPSIIKKILNKKF